MDWRTIFFAIITLHPAWTQSNYCKQLDCYFTNLNKSAINTEMPHIKNVEFRNFNMSSLSSNIGAHLPNLISLLAHNCSIDGIDSQFFKIVANLQRLNLSFNDLQVVRDRTFASARGVKILDLSHNSIRTIEVDAFLGLQSLEILSLAHNEVAVLESMLFIQLVNLTYLELRNNNLEKIILDTFVANSNLTNLGLSYNHIELIESTEKLSLTNLDLSHNRIKEITIMANLKSLATLNVSYNNDLVLTTTTFLGVGDNLRTLNLNGIDLQEMRLNSVLTPLVRLRNLFATLYRLNLNQLPRLPELEVVIVENLDNNFGKKVSRHNFKEQFANLTTIIVSNGGMDCEKLELLILRLEVYNVTLLPDPTTSSYNQQKHNDFNGIGCENREEKSESVYKVLFWILLPVTFGICGFALRNYFIANRGKNDPYIYSERTSSVDMTFAKYYHSKKQFNSGTLYGEPFDGTYPRKESEPVPVKDEDPAYCGM